jgi:hypothetical protein
VAEDGDHADTGLGLPYGVDTPQVTGRKVEKQILRDRGARQHPMSGAGRIKEDGHDEDNLYEIKNANRSFALNSEDLRQSWKRAAQQGRDAVWIVQFANGITAEMTLTMGAKHVSG